MLRVVTSQEPVRAQEDVLGMIYGGVIEETHTWVETTALLVTKCQGRPFGTYFMIVITDAAGLDEASELNRLSTELGKSLSECVVEKELVEKPHRFFPGSRYFHLVTVYGG